MQIKVEIYLKCKKMSEESETSLIDKVFKITLMQISITSTLNTNNNKETCNPSHVTSSTDKKPISY